MTVIQEFLEKSSVEPQPSSLPEQYQEAVCLFEPEFYSKALITFRSTHELDPNFSYVQDYIFEARSPIDAGHEKLTSTRLYLAVPIILIGNGL